MINQIIVDNSIGNLSDEIVLNRVQNEPWLFVALIDRYQDLFLSEIDLLVPDKDEAKDVVRETFGRIYMNAHRFETFAYATFSAWAYSILMSTARAHSHARRVCGPMRTASMKG